MPAKATHQGHCQVCGHCQMLPGGRLAKHGYTKRCGFFSGVCMGAGHLPFEQDISLIERAIAAAQDRAVALRAEAARLEVLADPTDVTRQVYHSGELGRYLTGYFEHHGRIEIRDGRPVFVYKWGDKEMTDWVNFTTQERLPQAALDENKQAAWRRNQMANEADQYVKWQQARITGWKPQPLIERA